MMKLAAIALALVALLAACAPEPTFEVDFDKLGYIETDGSVTLTGTITCSTPLRVYFDTGEVIQGEAAAYLDGSLLVDCQNTLEFSVTEEPLRGTFGKGRATVTVLAVADCPEEAECAVDEVADEPVKLRLR